MSPFVSGALGAATFLLLAGVIRRAVWHGRFRHAGHRRRAFMLRHLFRRLRTRPEQEQVVTAEADALAEAMRALRQDAWTLRAEVASLLSAPAVDVAAVKETLAQRLARADALRDRLAEALARVHAALDPSQRAELAALVQRGPGCHRRHAHA